MWHGCDVLDMGPGATVDRCLLSLSPGGSDAATVREFSLRKKAFITAADGGFVLASAKSDVCWHGPDELLVGTDTGDGSMTDSG